MTPAVADLLRLLTQMATVIRHAVETQPLVQLAVAGVALVLMGGLLRRATPLFAGFLRTIGNLGLIAALALAAVSVFNVQTGLDLPGLGDPAETAQVSGGETRVALGRDGHFWVPGTINGTSARFLVDTGATITTLAPETAEAAGLDADGRDVILETANGRTTAQRTTIARLRVGNAVARDLGAVVTPGMNGTNVLGMNFLSKLASWRVEGRTLILVPHHPT
jgi:aspartyl protease family protein